MKTPQERTELQRLAEQATPEAGLEWGAEFLGFLQSAHLNDKERAIVAYIAAANPAAILDLLSLAAECEELRADLERAQYEAKMEKQGHDSWKASGMTHLENAAKAYRDREALESRYSALEASYKELVAAADDVVRRWQDGAGTAVIIAFLGGLKDALKSLSLPSPTEQGATDG